MDARSLTPLALAALLAACGGTSSDDDTDAPPTSDDTDGVDTDDVGTGTLRINELLASNLASTERPADGLFPDWIELYNPSADDVDLGGATISDDLAVVDKHTLPADLVVPAGGYLVLWADDGTAPDSLPFKLTSAGESVGVWGADGKLWDSVVFPAQTTDVSWARQPDGSGEFAADDTPTAGARND